MSNELSDEQRSEIFASANSRPVGDATTPRRFRRPPKVAMWLVGAVVVLGVGGQFANHYLANLGSKAPASTTTSLAPRTTTTAPSNAKVSPVAFIGYRPIGTATAPSFTLLDQSNRRWTLASHQQQVVVLAFFDANCHDICPVEGAELRAAYVALGVNASKVTFAIVNTDPRDTHVQAAPSALVVPHLGGLASVKFLTGSLQQLNHVWTEYGVSVSVGAKASQMSHSNVLYFIGAHTTLNGLARPFATLSPRGTDTLSPADVALFAQGIAQVAGSLVK